MDDRSANPRIQGPRPEEWIDARDVLIVPDGPLSGGRLLSNVAVSSADTLYCVYMIISYVYVSYIL